MNKKLFFIFLVSSIYYSVAMDDEMIPLERMDENPARRQFNDAIRGKTFEKALRALHIKLINDADWQESMPIATVIKMFSDEVAKLARAKKTKTINPLVIAYLIDTPESLNWFENELRNASVPLIDETLEQGIRNFPNTKKDFFTTLLAKGATIDTWLSTNIVKMGNDQLIALSNGLGIEKQTLLQPVSFGVNGKALIDVKELSARDSAQGAFQSLAITPDESIIAAGTVGANNRLVIASFNKKGTINANFNKGLGYLLTNLNDINHVKVCVSQSGEIILYGIRSKDKKELFFIIIVNKVGDIKDAFSLPYKPRF